MLLNTSIAQTCKQLVARFSTIDAERLQRLKELAAYISACYGKNQIPQLNFICTHNSRRSHMGQFWGSVWPYYFGLAPIKSYSGGSEATACYPETLNAVRRAGAAIDTTSKNTNNPVHEIGIGPGLPNLQFWSKTYDDLANPSSDFAAILVCSAADEACPMVKGADLRILLPFNDPKHADGLPSMAATYDETCVQIGIEIGYAFQLAKQY